MGALMFIALRHSLQLIGDSNKHSSCQNSKELLILLFSVSFTVMHLYDDELHILFRGVFFIPSPVRRVPFSGSMSNMYNSDCTVMTFQRFASAHELLLG